MKMLEAAREVHPESISRKTVVAVTGVNDDTVGGDLTRLTKAGLVVRTGRGAGLPDHDNEATNEVD